MPIKRISNEGNIISNYFLKYLLFIKFVFKHACDFGRLALHKLVFLELKLAGECY